MFVNPAIFLPPTPTHPHTLTPSHSIGYPVVTVSFLIKHHITHVIRQVGPDEMTTMPCVSLVHFPVSSPPLLSPLMPSPSPHPLFYSYTLSSPLSPPLILSLSPHALSFFHLSFALSFSPLLPPPLIPSFPPLPISRHPTASAEASGRGEHVLL